MVDRFARGGLEFRAWLARCAVAFGLAALYSPLHANEKCLARQSERLPTLLTSAWNGKVDIYFRYIQPYKVYEFACPSGAKSEIDCKPDGAWAWSAPQLYGKGRKQSVSGEAFPDFADPEWYGLNASIRDRKQKGAELILFNPKGEWLESIVWVYRGNCLYTSERRVNGSEPERPEIRLTRPAVPPSSIEGKWSSLERECDIREPAETCERIHDRAEDIVVRVFGDRLCGTRDFSYMQVWRLAYIVGTRVGAGWKVRESQSIGNSLASLPEDDEAAERPQSWKFGPVYTMTWQRYFLNIDHHPRVTGGDPVFRYTRPLNDKSDLESLKDLAAFHSFCQGLTGDFLSNLPNYDR